MKVWLVGTAVCVHLVDRFRHVLNVEPLKEEDMRRADDVICDLSVPPIRKWPLTGARVSTDRETAGDAKRGRVVSLKRDVRGARNPVVFENVYDATRRWSCWEAKDRMPACRVEIGDVVLAEFCIRRIRPTGGGVFFELQRVAQVVAGPGVMWERG